MSNNLNYIWHFSFQHAKRLSKYLDQLEISECHCKDRIKETLKASTTVIMRSWYKIPHEAHLPFNSTCIFVSFQRQQLKLYILFQNKGLKHLKSTWKSVWYYHNHTSSDLVWKHLETSLVKPSTWDSGKNFCLQGLGPIGAQVCFGCSYFQCSFLIMAWTKQ